MDMTRGWRMGQQGDVSDIRHLRRNTAIALQLVHFYSFERKEIEIKDKYHSLKS